MNLNDLKAPFPVNRISWRVGSTNADKTRGLALAYIDARDVMERLDAVCGPENWQDRYQLTGATMICELGIRVSRPLLGETKLELVGASEWAWKADGAGTTDVEAEKGQISDAFKRAAVKWGIGRYLYDLDSPWVELEAAGRSYRIAKHEYARLQALLGGSKEPPPKQQMTPQQWTQDFLKTLRTTEPEKIEELLLHHAKALLKLKNTEPLLHGDIMRLAKLRTDAELTE